jgi:phosphoribosylglycinamide formyltransferase-1
MIKAAPLKIAILVSGDGSNLQAIIDGIESGNVNAELVCVVSNKANAYALKRADKHSIPTIVLENSRFANRVDYDTNLAEMLKNLDVQLVVLAGFMRLLSPAMIDAFPNAIMNIHPALLPSFPGLDPQQQALDYGVKVSGCTVHFVDCGTDTGPIIIQAAVPILNDDTAASLAIRIKEAEYKIYPKAINLFANKKLSINGRKVSIDE